MSSNDTGGLSAAQSRRIVKRAKAPTDKSPGRLRYTIRRQNGDLVLDQGLIADVIALFPRVPKGLLQRRLSAGERKFERLERPPETRASIRRKIGDVPMFRRREPA